MINIPINTIKKFVLVFLDLKKKNKANVDKNFYIIVNQGPGSFSSIRVSLAVAKGIKISHKVNLFGYLDTNLTKFNLENIEILINKNLIENKLIKPLYLS